MPTLFDPMRCGAFTLANRVVMAPLTRNRADAERVPTALMRTYYEQRATAGLIISEATQISPQGQGYRDTPGIYSDAQVHGWRPITDAVHAQGGRMVAQLWHVGRISHVSLQPGGQAPVSSTARRANGKTWVGGQVPSTAVVWIGQFATLYYFVHFLVILPLLGLFETPKEVPASINDAVLAKQLDANKAEVDAALAKVKALDPTNDADRKLVNDLSDALTKVSADLGSLSDSVSVSDATASKEKAAQLVADSAVVKAADHALATAVAPSSSK